MAFTSRAKQLEQLVQNIPVANQQTQQQLQAARAVQLQAAIGGVAPGEIRAPGQIQEIGAQAARQQAAIGLEQQQVRQQQLMQIGELGLAEQRRAAQYKATIGEIELDKQAQELANKLGIINRDAKNKLVNEQLQFQRDELGRTVMNERQLADYAILSSKNKIELQNKLQLMEHAFKRKTELMNRAQLVIETVLKRGYIREQNDLDQAHKKRLAELRYKAHHLQKQREIDAGNRQARVQGILQTAIAGGMMAV